MKTRLQLQGELQRADANAPKVYKNVFDVFAKTWRNEGIRGLQRGLVPAVRLSPFPPNDKADRKDSMDIKWVGVILVEEGGGVC